MTPSLSISPRTLLSDETHSVTTIIGRSAIGWRKCCTVSGPDASLKPVSVCGKT